MVTHVINTTTFRVAQRDARGELIGTIRRYRRAGVSWESISKLLFADYGIDYLKPETLRRWGKTICPDEGSS